MTHKIDIRRAAKGDIDEAHAWYEEQRTGLGAEFLDQIASTLKRVSIGPLRFPTAEGDVRRATVQRFPYSIYFRIRGNDIRIIAVVHQRRDPRTVAKRLGR